MAATIAKAIGYDMTRVKQVQRLGSACARAEANTWETFATAYIKADGSGYVEVKRGGRLLHRFDFGAE